MRITVLIDNASELTSDLFTEHGLSIYFEVDDQKWMVDVGASGRFAENAERLGVNITDVDYLVLSHAHYDHTGGLEEFIKRNSKAKIYLSSAIEGNSYFSTRRGSKRNISIKYSIVESNKERFIPINSDVQVSESVRLISNIPILFEMPKANRTLFVNDIPDNFRHELALSINTSQGTVVISSCSHLGMLNTLASVASQNVIAYIGGTHLIDSDAENQYETNDQLTDMIRKARSLYPDMKLITGHCTGSNAQKIFSETMGEKFTTFYSGFSTIL